MKPSEAWYPKTDPDCGRQPCLIVMSGAVIMTRYRAYMQIVTPGLPVQPNARQHHTKKQNLHTMTCCTLKYLASCWS